jgi:hypothetical protein
MLASGGKFMSEGNRKYPTRWEHEIFCFGPEFTTDSDLNTLEEFRTRDASDTNSRPEANIIYIIIINMLLFCSNKTLEVTIIYIMKLLLM